MEQELQEGESCRLRIQTRQSQCHKRSSDTSQQSHRPRLDLGEAQFQHDDRDLPFGLLTDGLSGAAPTASTARFDAVLLEIGVIRVAGTRV